MSEVRYMYESHMGGFYLTSEPMDDTYCEQCGDSDMPLGMVATREDALALIDTEIYNEAYVKEFLDDNFKSPSQ